ncbi:PREDICTED: uncharacterized protein LOC108557824 [Nicrophorus vespilloides]|uniref:Uncharacterized protein LOC108557824 n=1 Tax=Nicrophorus vespilloides TaxID=110193 RepID=A0ABM1M5Y7_NICVS|nr:PREDICTED: uncharacterized protein LOC108557824 [Nicrophorus vespilloides]
MDDKNKKPIKTMSRLSSLATRDFNLGGTKPKKVYTPNLNAVRNKSERTTKVNNVIKKERFKTRPQRSFNKNSQNDRFVQSSGVFSEGTAYVKRPTIYSDKHAALREAGTSSGMIKPKLGHSILIDPEYETTVVEDLLTYDENEPENDDGYQPIVLPLASNKTNFINSFKVKKEPEMNVKKELDEDNIELPKVNGLNICDGPMNISVKEENVDIHAPISFISNKNYDNEDYPISLVKLPDSLPGKGFDDDNNVIDYTLKQMHEGKIGKILVRASGQIDVVIGATNYTLDAVEAAQFTEELMCTSDQSELKMEPSISNIGSIKEKFVISPVWTDLLMKKK